jgi:hypothetical protein
MRIQLVYSFFSFRLTNFHRGQGLYFLEVVNSLQESLLCVRKLYMQADTCMQTVPHLKEIEALTSVEIGKTE